MLAFGKCLPSSSAFFRTYYLQIIQGNNQMHPNMCQSDGYSDFATRWHQTVSFCQTMPVYPISKVPKVDNLHYCPHTTINSTIPPYNTPHNLPQVNHVKCYHHHKLRRAQSAPKFYNTPPIFGHLDPSTKLHPKKFVQASKPSKNRPQVKHNENPTI